MGISESPPPNVRHRNVQTEPDPPSPSFRNDTVIDTIAIAPWLLALGVSAAYVFYGANEIEMQLLTSRYKGSTPPPLPPPLMTPNITFGQTYHLPPPSPPKVRYESYGRPLLANTPTYIIHI